MAWQSPKLDWVTNPKNPAPADFNRIEGNIDFLKSDIETKKGAIVNALDGVGLDVTMADTHAQIATKITNADQGTKIITPGTTNKIIAKGFHSGNGYVEGDANLTAGNILSGINIFGVAGTGRTPFVKSIQSFMATSPSASTNNVDVSISAVNTNNSIILTHIAGSGVDGSKDSGYVDFLDGETVRITIYGYLVTFGVMVIEFEGAVVKSKQKGSASLSQGDNLIQISEVDPAKSIAIVHAFYEQSSNLYGAFASIEEDGEYINLYVLRGSHHSSSWQVIEFNFF